MLTGVQQWVRRRAIQWFPSSIFYGPGQPIGIPPSGPSAVRTPDEALTLSPFWAGVRKYQSALGSLPLVTYQRDANGDRKRLESSPTYWILHDRPNPIQSRAALFEWVALQLFTEREVLLHVRLTGTGYLVGLYPIHCSKVVNVLIDDDWNRAWVVSTPEGVEVYREDEIIHLYLFSRDGIRGTRLLDYAGSSLGLHRQVQESAGAFYENAVRPSGYLKYSGTLDAAAVKQIKEHFLADYAGTGNRGKLPVTMQNGEFLPLNNTNADDAKIIEALSTSVPDIARWLGLSPLSLGDLSRGTYSNLGADRQAFYGDSLRPLLEKTELEFNAKIFGVTSSVYCEFDVNGLLRGDPQQQADVANVGIQNGTVLVNEQRAWLNLPPVDGGDVPRIPLNMGSATDLTQISGKGDPTA
ncbi:phage portal protein [Limnoglobus roseus]|uniref:Phage portal protein n=1 Tax=Limnoglobus roseus TaxID=2598579 RepID=A0A5C1AK37_9BACT|nr:phage portal protein [Limnoglobus roseus]QEL18537.1 phage portal protein [Limnoglobus roseus]